MMETLNRHFREIAGAAFQRHGFASVELAAQWGAIVGDELAKFCAPEKIRWPHAVGKDAPKQGGTLHVKAYEGRALELHYHAPRIVERVNQFFGYRAVSVVKFLPTQTLAPKPSLPKPVMGAEARKAWAKNLEDIADPDLAAALQRFAVHAAPHGPRPSPAHTRFSTAENRVLSQPSTSSRKIP